MEYTDPERFKIAMKDWESLSEKQRACAHTWSFHYHDVVKDHNICECAKCGARFNQKRGGRYPPRRSEAPTLKTKD